MRIALSKRLATVRAGIADATASGGRSVDDITMIVVTKFHPAALIAELAAHGVRDVGENRHQEAQAKASELAALHLTWHFVGQVQEVREATDDELAHGHAHGEGGHQH